MLSLLFLVYTCPLARPCNGLTFHSCGEVNTQEEGKKVRSKKGFQAVAESLTFRVNKKNKDNDYLPTKHLAMSDCF
jgi:hypothetical protein